MKLKLGYACINLSLGPDVSTNRGMVNNTWKAKGLAYASELASLNCQDLLSIMKWNADNGIKFYRLSSSIFPWMSEYDIDSLPDWVSIKSTLESIGKVVQDHGIRLEYHPGPFVVFPSMKPSVVSSAIDEIEKHSFIFDTIGVPATPNASINIHIGGVYGDRSLSASRWVKVYNSLSPNAKARLVVENDDKKNGYSVKHLYDMVYLECGAPITFDHFHHLFCTGDLSSNDAAVLAGETWGDIIPAQHYSSSRKIHQDSDCVATSHADYIHEKINTYIPADVMLESKKKDLALLQYIHKYPEHLNDTV